MKKTLMVILSLSLIAGAMAVPAEAGKKKKKPKRVERTVTITYQCPCGPSWGQDTPVGTGVGFWLAGGAFGGAMTAIGPDDKFVEVEVVDDNSGQAVKTNLGQDVDGDGLSESQIGSVCGTTEEPLEVTSPGTPVNLFVYEGVCDDGTTPSVATTGTITLTFSNMP